MPALEVSDVLPLIAGNGRQPDPDRVATELHVITALARAYTRGQGFDSDGNPGEDIRAVILIATARFHAHPGQVRANIVKGPQSASFGDGFNAWTLAELAVLHRYRVRAK